MCVAGARNPLSSVDTSLSPSHRREKMSAVRASKAEHERIVVVVGEAVNGLGFAAGQRYDALAVAYEIVHGEGDVAHDLLAPRGEKVLDDLAESPIDARHRGRPFQVVDDVVR